MSSGTIVFERVHTMTDFYDGPRRGIADLNGEPHYYESEWSDLDNNDADTFLLTPVDRETFELALEDWAIWKRWETAFHKGDTDRSTDPALPEDRQRHHELSGLLEGRLVTAGDAKRRRAEFRLDAARDLVVRWHE